MELKPIPVDDVAQVVTCAKVMHANSTYASIPFDERAVERTFYAPNVYSIGVYDEDRLVGGALYCVNNAFFNLDFRILTDLAVFVLPSVRSLQVFKMLMTGIELSALKHKANRIVLGITAPIVRDLHYKLYERAGFVECGRLFVKDVKEP